MSDKRSPEDRVEKRRRSVEEDTIKINFLKILKKLNLGGARLDFHMAYLKVTIAHDLSGEEWDDNNNDENG
jgi:hypothetical protein